MNTALTTTGDAFGQFQTATGDFQAADTLYALFLQHLPPVGVQLPDSVWLSNPTVFSTASLTTYLQTLRNARSPLPIHQLEVEAVATDPPAVSVVVSGATQIQILPESDTIMVTATVGNLGNQTENDTIVTASLQPPAPGYLASDDHEIGTLPQGDSDTVMIGPLKTLLEVPVTLTVTITPPAGQTGVTGTTKSITFEMPSPNSPPLTTTTTVAPPPTTTAGAGSGTSGTSATTSTSGGAATG
jgi:hypothetical protein